MPKKDGAMDDNKKTTKDVVNKKQKQMLNQEEIDPAKIAEALGGYIVEETKDDKRKKAQNKAKKSNQQKVTKVGRANVKGVSKLPSEAEFSQAAAIAKRDIESDKSDLGGAVEGDLKRSMRSAQQGKGGRQKLGDTTKGGKVTVIQQANPNVPIKKNTTANIKPGSIPDPKDTEFTTQVKKGVETKKGVVRGKTGKPEAYLGTETRTTAKGRARKSKEIKDAARKAFPDAKTPPSDIKQFRRSATRTKVKQQELPLKKTSKGVEVKTLKEPRSAKRQKPKISYQDLKKQIDVREPSYLGKSGGKLPVLKGTSKEAIKTQKTYKGQKEFMKGFSFDASGRKAARAAKKSAMATATKKLGRKAAGKAAVGGLARFGAKRIPGVGMAIAAGEAGARMAAGDKVGAAIAGAEGIASMVPGLGTAASAAIGAYGVKRDIKRAAGVAGVAKKVKKLARDKGAKEIASTQFAKDANKLIKPEFKPFKALKKKVKGGGRMMGAKTVGGAALRVGGIGMGLDMARRAMFKAPKPKLDTGVVGKRSAGG